LSRQPSFPQRDGWILNANYGVQGPISDDWVELLMVLQVSHYAFSIGVAQQTEGAGEEMILRDEVPDEALEAAAFPTLGGFPTLPNTYCFACPSIHCEATQSRRASLLLGFSAPGEAYPSIDP
jgi:hypothetical protein